MNEPRDFKELVGLFRELVGGVGRDMFILRSNIKILAENQQMLLEELKSWRQEMVKLKALSND
jgi:hypothetical protein